MKVLRGSGTSRPERLLGVDSKNMDGRCSVVLVLVVLVVVVPVLVPAGTTGSITSAN
jgi:hypothetical protein